ncbi:ATP-dependent nuclease [Nocardia abscessus]|uniref:ATP-dependent nuclease n=1 Tax=Nocardia abscessus TaxID=120957 RepID=UPI0024540AFB|nr:AAA family ATPase [Nocardia abscessus]
MDSGFAPTLSRLDSDWKTADPTKNGWPQFLQSIQLEGIRGWQGQSIEFRYPIVVISGENGSGKSTVLKSAAAAYSANEKAAPTAKSFSPDDFFPTTPWETVSGVTLNYTCRIGTVTRTVKIHKPTKRWRGMEHRLPRPTFFLDISRTQPIDTLIGYGRLARDVIDTQGAATTLNDEYRTKLSLILSRDYSDARVQRHNGKSVGILSANGGEYSNYHQGAGEDATFDLLEMMQSVPRNSLVLIDEVEASLHPKAQRRLMTELIDISRAKRVQFIVSTHSPFIIEQLPLEARIHILNARDRKEIIYGVTADYALSLMDDRSHCELTIFCEDQSAEQVIDSMVRKSQPADISRIRIVPIGPASAVKEIGRISSAKLLYFDAVAIVDSDQGATSGCITLPGVGAPEKAVYKSFEESHWKILAERLGVRAGDIMDAADDAMRVPNHHVWTKNIAAKLSGSMRPSRVWESAVDVWIHDVLDSSVVDDFVSSVLASLAPASS